MPISWNKRDGLSLQLIMLIENAVMKYCEEKKISNAEISELLDYHALNRLARNLRLKVKVEELTEELITAPKETPLEIIGKIVAKVANNEEENNPPSSIEVALRGGPIVIL